LADAITWPELTEPSDYPEDLEKLAGIDWDGIAEYRGKLEAYFTTLAIAGRHAFRVLGLSRSELVEMAELLGDGAQDFGRVLGHGTRDLARLARYVRAAEVRLFTAIALRDEKAEREKSSEVARS
jgi:hypothetical protein